MSTEGSASQTKYKVILAHGLNDVIYEDDGNPVPGNAVLYHEINDGTLKQIRDNSPLGSSNIVNSAGNPIGTVDQFKTRFYTLERVDQPDTMMGGKKSGGKRKTHRNKKSKKVRKSKSRKNRRKTARR